MKIKGFYSRPAFAIFALVVTCSTSTPLQLFAATTMEWNFPQALNTTAPTDLESDYYPEIAHDGAGNWVCVWSSAISASSTRDFDTLVSTSSDNGKTWTVQRVLDPNANVPYEEESEDDFHPDVFTDGAGNWVAVWYSYFNLNGTIGDDIDILVSRSTDNGTTWTPSIPLNSDAETDHLAYDYPSDYTPHLATDGNGIWIAAWHKKLIEESDYDIYISRSTDNGTTWSTMSQLTADMASDAGDDNSPRIAVDDAGNWIISWNSDNLVGTNGIGDDDIHYSRSADGGLTWSARMLLNTDGTSDNYKDAYGDLVNDGQVWLATWNRELVTDGDDDVMLARSTDGGITWSAPAVINNYYDTDGSADDLRPRLATDKAGVWVATWYAKDHFGFPWGPDHDLVFVRSDDGGLTWSDGQALNGSAPMDFAARDYNPEIRATETGQWLTVWFSTYDLGGTIGTERDLLYSWSCIPTMGGDGDCDGDVDLDDLGAFVDCLSGPIEGSSFISPSETCLNAFDLDGNDGDVDLEDFAAFQNIFGNP